MTGAEPAAYKEARHGAVGAGSEAIRELTRTNRGLGRAASELARTVRGLGRAASELARANRRLGPATSELADSLEHVGWLRFDRGDYQAAEAYLRRAATNGDFEVHYQPIVLLESGRCVGFESLIRWNRDGKPVSPAKFIPILEKTGLILEAGRWAPSCNGDEPWRYLIWDRTRDAEGWPESKQQPGQNCGSRREEENRPFETWQGLEASVGQNRCRDAEDPTSRQERQAPSEHPEEQAFDQQLSDQSPASGPERCPNRQFLCPRGGAIGCRRTMGRNAGRWDECRLESPGRSIHSQPGQGPSNPGLRSNQNPLPPGCEPAHCLKGA